MTNYLVSFYMVRNVDNFPHTGGKKEMKKYTSKSFV